MIAGLMGLLSSVGGMAQTAQLTERLGRTVFSEDVCLSPDGTHLAWVQATGASSTKVTYLVSTATAAKAEAVKFETGTERCGSGPAGSPDSTSRAFFSAPGEPEQAQLWTVATDGTWPKQQTQLQGYAARPRWSHDGRQIAFLYIEGGGGPLLAAPALRGVIVYLK